MITVRNTKELEEKYNLNFLPDTESIRITGGLDSKSKYNREPYISRTTYSVGQLKYIIQNMKEIESQIPSNWNQWQIAKYIYTVLANNIEYNFNQTSYDYLNPSNLSPLVHKKGICAGYALIFKEMMDRQGIQCDYIRGIAATSPDSPKNDKHAWNILTIDGIDIPVDLTWDSINQHQGNNSLFYFGNDYYFSQTHEPDDDERNYIFSTLDDSFVNSIDISPTNKNQDLALDKMKDILHSSLKQTIQKAIKLVDPNAGIAQGILAIKKYILENNPNAFTRDGMARDNIEKYITKSDMISLLVNQYVTQCATRIDSPSDILGNALRQNLLKYDIVQARRALRDYILSGSTLNFTRDGMARDNIEQYVSQDNALDIIIKDYISQEIELIQGSKNSEKCTYPTISSNFVEISPCNIEKNCFHANEFSDVTLPEEKRHSLVQKAMQWISNKSKNYQNNMTDNENERISEKSDLQR